MKNYTKEEKEKINHVKGYLRSIRSLKQEAYCLQLEFNEIPEPHSPKLDQASPGGYIPAKDIQLNNYVIKRDLVLKKLALFNEIFDSFMPLLYLLNNEEREIINTYITAKGYGEMIGRLEENFLISESTYHRMLPEICLKLYPYIQNRAPVSIEDLNIKYNQYIKETYFND